MATAATRLMTAAEFHAWVHRPENGGQRYELVRGEVVTMTKPGKLHGFVCGNIVWILGNYVRQRRKGYVCSNDTGVLVERDPDTVRGPDVLLFDDAMAVGQIATGYAESPPLLAVEVLSPSDTAGNVNERIVDQLRFETKLVWLIDPVARNVTVYRPGKEPYIVREGEELTGDDVLPGFRCRVAEFFFLPTP